MVWKMLHKNISIIADNPGLFGVKLGVTVHGLKNNFSAPLYQ